MPHTLHREAFQQILHGQRTDLYTLRGEGGLQVAISNYGARLVQIAVPDGQGGLVDVALGYDSLQGYLDGQLSMGALIGRWAGRVRSGQLTVPGRDVPLELPTNSGPHHHHGGPRGSRFQVFAVDEVQADALVLSHVFRTEDDGVPGTVRLTVRIAVTPDNALQMAWTAEAADAPTIANITGHAFFNLAGHGSTHRHQLQVPASHYVPLALDLCPLGQVDEVQGTVFDFRELRTVGEAIAQPANPSSDQLALAGGLDHYLVLDSGVSARAPFALPAGTPGLRLAARLREPVSGRSMQVWSTAPGVQVYAGHGLKADPARDRGRGGDPEGTAGWLWQPGDGICLEPMEYPDAPNHPAFPKRWLAPGEVEHGAIVYRFM